MTTADGRSWRSVEGPAAPDGDPRWPASPVLIEVSLVAAGARPAILGVGLAGRSHYSLSAIACDDQADTLLVEAACRVVEPAGWLGTTYEHDSGRVQVEADRAAALPATVRWTYRIGPAGLEPVVGTFCAAQR